MGFVRVEEISISWFPHTVVTCVSGLVKVLVLVLVFSSLSFSMIA